VKQVQIGGATLYLGDCREILPTLPKVDAVVTDPPFEEEAHTLQCRVKRGGGVMVIESLPFAQIDDRDAYSEAMVRASRGWVLAFCQAEAVGEWRDSFEAAGAAYRRSMVWIKPDGMPQYSGDRPGMGYESIVGVWAGEGGSKWNGGGRHGVFTFNKNDGAGPAPHPTTKPVRLMEELVSLFTSANNVIGDPFMGSGTTGVACANLGRKFIGIEIDERYFAIACERITAAYAQQRLFA
jgi:site-specific DNA-methyltransferase (adenine-specific)